MRKSIFILFVGIIISMTSCRKDFDTVPSTGGLEFSKQTVYLDTVFTNIGSSTYMLKVYNRGSDDITIPEIRLGKGETSKYRIMVDGMTGNDGKGKIFPNVELLAKDSLFIFIETTASIADANPTDFLYTDQILFNTGTSFQQSVNLVTLIQDAVFLYPEKYSDGSKEIGFELNEADPVHGNELVFTNEKPYVIYGYAGVPSGKTLQIQAGARVHFHADSGIIVKEGGTLNIDGNASLDPENPQENEVVFEGDRLEPGFSETPGQWGTVWLMPGSGNNSIDHLTLKNSVVGLLVEECPLNITNSQIYNSSNVGILARRATNLTAENVVVNLAGQMCLACPIGGNYSFKHCTFNNNWNSTKQLTVLLANYIEYNDGSVETNGLDQANFYNCIIYGYNKVQLFLDKYAGDDLVAFNTNFDHCLVKFNDNGTQLEGDTLYDPIRTEPASPTAAGNYRNIDPKFYNENANKLNIDTDSGAFQKGNPNNTLAEDVSGKLRTSNPPDIGAYQSAAFPQ